MAIKLTEKIIKGLEVPSSGHRIYYDDKVTGFGVRIGTAGRPVYILNYRVDGVERRITLGKGYNHKGVDGLSLAAAREKAEELIGQVRGGADPLGGRAQARTMKQLCDDYEKAVVPRLRPSSQYGARHYLNTYIRPTLANKGQTVASITLKDIEAMHATITKERGPYIANRVVGFASAMFGKAIKWGMRETNPTAGVERNREHKRENYVDGEQVKKLVKVLDEYEDRTVARIVKILLLTGSRKSEVLGMRWDELDLDAGIWTKAPERTKQGRKHVVPISDDVQALLVQFRKEGSGEGKASIYVFPGRGKAAHRKTIHKEWVEICRRAELVNITHDETGKRVVKHTVRLHDLRHSYASFLVSAGMGLEVIGRLLGHSSPQTTHRYAHLHDAALRRATQLASDTINTAAKGEAK